MYRTHVQCITVAHSSVETNFSTVLILVQNERCTKSYENKVCTKTSCYTVDGKNAEPGGTSNPSFNIIMSVYRETMSTRLDIVPKDL